MHVKAILDEKGRNVLTIRPDATLQDAARTLHENRIGALVVLGLNEQIKGILSERDIINAVAKNGAEALGKTVSTVMTSNVHRCAEDTTIDALMSSQIELVKSRDTLFAVMESEKLRSVPEFNGTAVSPITIPNAEPTMKSRIHI